MPETESRPDAIVGRSARRGRRHGIEIKPGSVKQARADAGMSLADVANGVVSRTAIYFVETGKAKPSMETLRLIAERTGRPIDYFLASPSTMEPRSSPRTLEIELLLASNDCQGAVAAGQALLTHEKDADTTARARYLMAYALLRLAQPEEARRLAAVARDHFEKTGDQLMTAECLGHEASAAYLAQDPNALGLAQRALEICRSLRPVPHTTEGRLLFVLGSVHATNQDWPAAIDCYERAIAAGEVIQDLRRLSLMYSGLSLAYSEIGQLNQSAYYAQRALTIHETLNDRLSLARSENNLGLLLIKRGDLAGAEQHLLRGMALWDESAAEVGRAELLLSLCELEVARMRLDDAERFAVEARDCAEELSEKATLAEAHMWLGRIAAERAEPALVDAEFREAWGILDALGAPERLSRCHVEYAELLERRGDIASANHHLRIALTQLHPGRVASTKQERSASA
ncbi:MAG TPA: helix-turn-helix transcriptional regulator [Candidatus Dormibacteraeota bacterium]|nr:helix-turn-helix transcriptional regulator [Candidatus Dormibacteraeota bacterium]